MNRIPLNYTQRQSLHPLRKDIEARIRELKKQLRGKPHTVESAGHQSTLHYLRGQATAIYTLLAGAFGREHTPKTEETLKGLREQARYYNAYQKGRRAPTGLEPMALMLVEAETPPAAQTPVTCA